ncbi:ABC transporter substrate-binding protein [Nonomuraea sp. NPDC059194]|uniref:ABC transporter substrate-binding protein n=1 Tax=Nonomuraea sp. NPDC059194 TaxID=3346764 RepID=UPI0036D172BB
MKCATLAVAAGTLLTLTACGGAGDDGGVEIEVMTGLQQGQIAFKAVEAATKEFEAANPNIDVRLVPGTPSYEQDMKVRLASRDVPDVFNTHGWSRDRYKEFLIPLSDQPWADKLNPALDKAMRDTDRKFYALPFDTQVSGFSYNVSVLADNGIDPASLTTWEAFDAACAKLKAVGIIPIGASGKDGWTGGNLADWLATSHYDAAELKSLDAGTFDAAAYKPVLEQLSSWRKEGFFNKDYSSATGTDLTRLLATGKIAFTSHGPGVAPAAQEINPDVKLGFMPIPSSVIGPFLVSGEATAFGAAKGGAHSKEALAYLEFLAQPKTLSKLAGTFGATPGLTSATSDLGMMQASYDRWVVEAKTPVHAYFDRVHLPNGMWNTMVTTADAMITGQGDSDDGAAQMKKAFDGLYGQD